MVNNDTDTSCLLFSDTRLLQLCKSKSTALTNFAVVADSLAADGGAKEREGSNTQGCGLGLARITSTEFPSWLIKPGANPALPVLPEVVVVKNYDDRILLVI